MYHLAVLHKIYLDGFLDGTKTIESRFTKVRCAPFGKVNRGDIVYLKLASGPVLAKARVKDVLYFAALTPEQVRKLKEKYQQNYAPLNSKYATIIFLEDIQRVKPLRINKRDRAGWVVLDPRKHPYFDALTAL
jgi:hypothetical protein